jgi:ABC-type glycerol-3-phosphate transport system substrate-binding protein
MLSYLRTGRGVAPRILPDVMLMPAESLAEAASEGLVQPIDELPLDDEMFTDLYPAARSLSRVGDSTYGYPLAMTEMGHIAYDGNVITRTIPLTWPAFTEIENSSFVFPAAGVDGGKLALQFYLEHGGKLVDENGAPQLEVEPLTMALRQLDAAAESEFIIPASGTITTLAESWQLFQGGSATSAQTNTDQFLSQRSLGETNSFAPIPGVFDAFAPHAGAWVLVVTTPDPARQAIAAELISWLGSAANMGEWSRQSGHVPARRTAFEAWPADDPYANFLRQQAERAQPFPAEATSAILTALADAVSAVVRGESTPAVAAQAASASLRQ